ncbi:hypothetical protein EUX98_g7667 [Antrodiella citrinella]|uniref:Uncharacterized protein n=1 Tax=Antrodiella citrinella TaxID=2447956 RepID=A0A4S4MLA1_9APHY|nr:hypothetical protein EUX98_g7667 [Antrodiella citrinella]
MFTPFGCIFLLFALAATLAGAAPSRLFARQTGDLQCNIARVKIVGSILQAAQTARNLTQELSCGCGNSSSLIANVTSGIITAEDAVAEIVGAIFTGQAAPASARTQVGDGLTLALESAGNITSTDPAVTSNLATLTSQLIAAGQAGDDVLQDCN